MTIFLAKNFWLQIEIKTKIAIWQKKTPFLQKWDILKKFNTLWIWSCSPFCTCAAGLQWCYGTFVRCACRRYLPRRHGLWKLFWFDSPIAPRPAWRKTIASHLACKINHLKKKPIWPPETSKVLNWLEWTKHNWLWLLLNRKVSLLLWNSNTGKNQTLCTVFENHSKSLISQFFKARPQIWHFYVKRR